MYRLAIIVGMLLTALCPTVARAQTTQTQGASGVQCQFQSQVQLQTQVVNGRSTASMQGRSSLNVSSSDAFGWSSRARLQRKMQGRWQTFVTAKHFFATSTRNPNPGSVTVILRTREGGPDLYRALRRWPVRELFTAVVTGANGSKLCNFRQVSPLN